MYRRDDLFQQLGLNPNPANFAEFKELCKQATDAKANRWAITQANVALYFVEEMLGVPNAGACETESWSRITRPRNTRRRCPTPPVVESRLLPSGQLRQQRSGQEVVQCRQRVDDCRPLHRLPQFYADNVAGPSFAIAGCGLRSTTAVG